MTYQAPVSDIAFALKHSAGFSAACTFVYQFITPACGKNCRLRRPG